MQLRHYLIALTISVLAVLGLAALPGATPDTAHAQVSFSEDCLSYDPSTLRIQEGDNGWSLLAGSQVLALYYDRNDAERGLTLARAHTEHCFIGRDNTRPDRKDYIFEYWQGDSGMDVTLPQDDCIAYDRDNLSVTDAGASGWNVMDDTSILLLLDTRQDAQNARELLGMHDNLCFIGRDVPREERSDYLMTYLTSDLTLVPLDPQPVTVIPELPGSGDDDADFDGPLMPIDPVVTIDPGILTMVPPLPGGASDTRPAPENCISYDPSALVLRNTPDGWMIGDATNDLLVFASQADAQLGAQVAMTHTQLCRIGQGNTRPTPYRYEFEYWKGDSGLGAAPPREHCTAYDPTALQLASTAAGTWHVFSNRTMLGAFDNEADALRAEQVLATRDELCLIGVENTQPNRFRYIHSYLLVAPVSGSGAPVATDTPTPFATPTPSRSGTGSVPVCPGAPAPRMVVGQPGRVTYTTGTPVRVRSGAGLGFSELAQLPEGAVFQITNGPDCADGYYWWAIQTDTGLTGWMAEGLTGNYFIEPITP